MKNKILLLILTFIFSFSSYSQISEEYQLKEASKSAMVWFNNLNTGNYQDAWNGLSVKVKNQTNFDEWFNAVSAEMFLFGELNGRVELKKEFKNTLEGLGDGYYAEFSYAVVYENTIEHSEYLILHQDSKRNWKVLIFSYEFRQE